MYIYSVLGVTSGLPLSTHSTGKEAAFSFGKGYKFNFQPSKFTNGPKLKQDKFMPLDPTHKIKLNMNKVSTVADTCKDESGE